MSRERRLETVLAILVVLAGAFYARAAYIPPFPERQVEVAGDRVEIDYGQPSKWFSAWSVGDGQAFAVIAADPSGSKLGEEIKEPAYRFSRAGFGWLAALTSLGKEQWIPYGLGIASLAALLGNLGLAVWLRDRLGWKALILLVNPALYLGIAGDTAEPLGVLFLTLALATGGWWWAALLGVTRPTYLVALVGRRKLPTAGAAAALALLAYSIWKFWPEVIPGGGRFDIPLAGYLREPSLAGAVLLVVAIATLIYGSIRRDWSWVISAALIMSLGHLVTEDPINAWRASGLLPVLWAFGPGYTLRTRETTDGSDANRQWENSSRLVI